MNKYIGISIGDIEGIGIELLIKLWKKKKIKNIILFSNFFIIDKYFKSIKFKEKIDILNENLIKNNNLKNKFYIFDLKANDNFENTYLSLLTSHKIVLKYKMKGLITLPLNKEKIIKNIDTNFIGQTELFENLENKKYTNMFFHHKNINITTLTTHIKVNDINKFLFKENFIFNKIKILNETLKNKFKIKEPKLIISGLNPHAGENGLIGNEETKYIIPQLNKLRKNNIRIDGPISADSILINRNIKKYDCFVFLYHDQALIIYKYISQNKGVHLTSGLKILRVSPDHGTANDLVGTNKASYLSLLNCYKFINKINI